MWHSFVIKIIKNSMKKLHIILGLVIILVIGTLVLSSDKAKLESEKPLVKIGISGPLSGSLAFAGDAMRNAAQMAIEERTDSNNRYEIVFEDDSFDPKKAASAVVKMVSVDKVDAFMTFASAAGNIANPIAEKYKVPHISIASDPNIAKGDYNFTHWTTPSAEAQVFIEELNRRGIKKIALLGANIQGITAVMDEVERQVKGTDIQIVAKEVFNFGTTDFRTLISKVRAQNPEIYVPIAFSPELEILAKQIKDAGITEPMTSLEGFELTDKPELFEGLWYVNAADASEEFRIAYKNRFGKDPVIATANAYDIVKMIIDSAERTSNGEVKPTPEAIKNALYDLDMKGALGNLKIDKDGFVLTKAVVRIIEGGKPKTIR